MSKSRKRPKSRRKPKTKRKFKLKTKVKRSLRKGVRGAKREFGEGLVKIGEKIAK